VYAQRKPDSNRERALKNQFHRFNATEQVFKKFNDDSGYFMFVYLFRAF